MSCDVRVELATCSLDATCAAACRALAHARAECIIPTLVHQNGVPYVTSADLQRVFEVALRVSARGPLFHQAIEDVTNAVRAWFSGTWETLGETTRACTIDVVSTLERLAQRAKENDATAKRLLAR